MYKPFDPVDRAESASLLTNKKGNTLRDKDIHRFSTEKSSETTIFRLEVGLSIVLYCPLREKINKHWQCYVESGDGQSLGYSH
jgi:hypothetical protein